MSDKISLRADDLLTQSGAGILAKAIETYWRGRGFNGIVAERYRLDGFFSAYGVRSNIGPDGFPPRTAVVAHPRALRSSMFV